VIFFLFPFGIVVYVVIREGVNSVDNSLGYSPMYIIWSQID